MGPLRQCLSPSEKEGKTRSGILARGLYNFWSSRQNSGARGFVQSHFIAIPFQNCKICGDVWYSVVTCNHQHWLPNYHFKIPFKMCAIKTQTRKADHFRWINVHAVGVFFSFRLTAAGNDIFLTQEECVKTDFFFEHSHIGELHFSKGVTSSPLITST